ncbi:hypothetical protein T296_11560 [Pantoea agglomerans Eh318]|nr:hypothetical protein T296_11560 [Pantoea agglomerans Eh318]
MRVTDLSAPDATGDDALDQKIAEAKSKIAEEGLFYRSVITANHSVPTRGDMN